MGEDRTGEPQANQERLTVAQAAARLGITEGAVRSRIKRETLPTAKEGGAVYVLLGDGTSQSNQPPNTGVDGDQSELIVSLQDQFSYLREQLDAEREARTEERRRHDTVVAQLTSRIPAIEAPASPERESTETAEEAPDRAEPRPATGEAQAELDAERARREMAESTLRQGMTEQRRRREEAERERDELRRELYALREPRKSPRTPEEQKGRGSPTPLREELRRAHSGGRGGKVYSEDRRSMPNDQTVKDATRLLRAFSTNHEEARMGSPHGMDRPFYPSWADAEQAGLNRARRDTAMRWLVQKNMLESEEEPENPLDTGEGFYSKYGSVFRITDAGRELLEEDWERRPE